MARSVTIGALAAAAVLIMLVAASMPAIADDPNSPDLVINESSVSITPQPLVEGVPTIVSFEVSNVGQQKSYSLIASLFDQGVEVANTTNSELAIGAFWVPLMVWTPTVPGNYDLTMKVWYGPHSDKEDVKWADNTVLYNVDVRSRPDAYVASSALSYDAPNPDYVVDGEMVTLTAVIENQGTADLTYCNVSLWEAAIVGQGELIERRVGLSIPGSGSISEDFYWDTSGWSGKRRLIVDVTDVRPNETDTMDNTAWLDIKVHTKEDKVFTTRGNTIDSPFKLQFFYTVEGSGDLTVMPTGNVTVYQDFDDQYDLVVTEQGKFVIDGGRFWSARNFTVFLSGNAQLTLKNWADTNIRIIATGNCRVTITDSYLDSPGIHMTGGTLTITNSTVVTDQLYLDGTEVTIEGKEVTVGETVFFNSGVTSIRDCEFHVVREYDDFGAALSAHPELEDYDPETNEVQGLSPAITATGGAVVNLYNVSVESQVLITSEDNRFWTHNRLGAEGRTSYVNVYRYLDVHVRDWSQQVVPGAFVEVLDYFDEMVLSNGTTDESGDVTLEVLTDYVTEAQKPFVGNLRLRTTAYERTSEDMRFSHNKYPDMDVDTNVLPLDVEMPPNPHPVVDEIENRFKLLYNSPHEILVGGEFALDKNLIVDNTEVTIRDTWFTMEQVHDFEWFILVRGEFGTLNLINSTLDSDFLYTIFLEDGATLNMTMGSELRNVRIVAADDSVLEVVDSIIDGGIYAECGAIEMIRSHLEVEHTRMEASTISITGGHVHEGADLYIKANDVHLVDVELTAEYEINKDVGVYTLRDLVELFGWSLLNNEEYLTNLSLGYFDYFSEESNITVETSHLTVDNALIYAMETHILVRRSPLPDQATIRDSWVGGIELELISDDLRAEHSQFNRVLDDFEGADHAELYSVMVPGIICSGSATVDRFWYITVNVFDGAGSVVHGALLEVYATETDEKLLPVPGTESLSTSRTNTAGRLTVPVRTNWTDATGDYFVGSIYFFCVYDTNVEEPLYSNTIQATIKSDRSFFLYFEETITPPEKEILYCLFNVTYAGPSQDLRFYHHTFQTLEEAEAFLLMVNGIEPERTRTNWTMVRNSTMNMTFVASQKINDVWQPLSIGMVYVYILDGHNVKFDTSRIGTYVNGTPMVYEVRPDENGWGNVSIHVPSSLANFQLYIAIAGGQFDSLPQPIEGREWNFTVAPPQTIHVDNTSSLSSNPVIVGTSVTVQGYVRYIYTHGGVEGAEVTIEGQHISTTNGRTDGDGRFSINFQAPIQVSDDLILTIRAEDPRTGEVDTMDIEYDVVPPPPDVEEDETPWALIWTIIIIAVLAFAIAFGAVMMYRRHYGEVVECGECGAFIPATSTNCPKCGIEFETDLARCSECEAWIPANSSSCPVCGTAFTIESLEEQVAREEAEEEVPTIDQVTTSTATVAPLALDRATEAKWGDREEKRRRRIKKRVKKRLTVTDTTEEPVDEEGAKDLFIGDESDSTRLPGLDVDESSLSDEDLSRLLPTEDMLKDLMLTSDEGAVPDETEPLEPEAELDLGEPEEELEEPPMDEPEAPAPDELEEVPLEDVSMEEPMPEPGALEEIPAPEEPEAGYEDEGLVDLEEPEPEEEEGPGGKELLSELGLMAEEREEPAEEYEGVEAEEEGSLTGLLSEDEESKEAPKLCPNCGGNWILYKDGEYTCRICGEKW